MCTHVFVLDDLKNAYLFKNPGNKSCRTEKVTKWPVVDETCKDNDYGNNDDVGV